MRHTVVATSENIVSVLYFSKRYLATNSAAAEATVEAEVEVVEVEAEVEAMVEVEAE
jgi:hypothetical protein